MCRWHSLFFNAEPRFQLSLPLDLPNVRRAVSGVVNLMHQKSRSARRRVAFVD